MIIVVDHNEGAFYGCESHKVLPQIIYFLLDLDECDIIVSVSRGEETPYCFVFKGFPLFLYIRVWFLSHQGSQFQCRLLS